MYELFRIYRYLDKNNINFRQRLKTSQDREKRVVKLYNLAFSSIDEIAKEVGLSTQYVNKILKKTGTKRNRRSVSLEEKENISKLYNDKKSIKEIAVLTGYREYRIREWLKALGDYSKYKKFLDGLDGGFLFSMNEVDGKFVLQATDNSKHSNGNNGKEESSN